MNIETIINGWTVIVALVCLLIFLVCNITKKNIIEGLKYIVSTTESDLGSGTGQLKLRKAYMIATSQFPILKILPFSTFSKWVDLALKWMRVQLDSNKNIESLVKEGDLK